MHQNPSDKLFINEGGTATYEVKLKSRGTGNVTVTPSSANTDLSFSPTALTFTTADWNTNQTVTVTAAADETTDNEPAPISYTASGGNYPAITETRPVEIRDTTPTLQLSTDPSAVTEGTPISLTVTSDRALTGTLPVRLTLAARSSSGFTAADIPGTLGPRNFDADFGSSPGSRTGTVSIPTSRDSATEGAEAYRITLSDSTGYAVGTDVTADGTLNDLVTAGVTISDETLTVTEGASTTYTVVLDTDPGAQVVVTPTSAPVAKATVSGALTFTTATNNWSTAQTVTVTGVAAGSATISHGVTGYGAVTSADSVDVTVNAVAAPVLSVATSTTSGQINLTWTHAGSSGRDFFPTSLPPAAQFSHWEVSHRLKGVTSWMGWGSSTLSGGTSRRTVAASLANAYPDGAVVEVRVNAVATITSGSNSYPISGPQSNTRTVTYKNDDLDALTFTGDPVTVAVNDTATYTVALTKAYGGVLSVTSDDTDKVTVSPSTLTFTTSTYNTAQTVTVTGVATGGSPGIDHAFRLTGATADAIPDAGTVGVTVNAAVSKPGQPTNFQATAGDGQVVLTWANPNDASITGYKVRYAKTADRGSASFSLIDGSSASTVTHTVGSLENGEEYSFKVRAVNSAGDGAATAWKKATPTAVTPDGVTVTATTLSVNEGSSNTYTVVLDTEPSGNVIVTVAGESGEVTASPKKLTFTDQNYGTAQTVTVSAGADEDSDNDTATLTHSASGGGYNSVSIEDVDVTVTDTTPTLQLLTDPAAVTEGEDISLTVTSDKVLTGTLSVRLTLAARSSSTFTAADIPGTLGPRNFDADFGDAPGSRTGTVSIATSTDTATEGAEAYRITLSDSTGYAVGTDTTADGVLNDRTSPSVVISRTSLTVAEGGSGTYTVKLNTNPGSSTVTVTASESSDAVSLSPSSLTFTSSSYSQAQRVTVTGEDDANTVNETVTISHTVSGYSGVSSVEEVTVTTDDDDDAPSPGVTIAPETLEVAEGGTGAYTVKLNTAPTAPVTVTVGGASGEVTVTGSPLTFTTSNYGTAQRVTVTAGEDEDTVNDSATLTHSAASSDTNYGASLTIASVRVTVTDNDTPSIVAPAQPTGLAAQAGNAEVTLSWANPDNATISKWQVQREEGSGSYGAWVDVPGSTASTTSHTVTGLSNGTAYSFRIRAVNAGGNSPASAEVRATPMAPPLKPTGVTATAGHGQVTLSWDNPDNATISKWQYQQKQGDGSYGPWMDIPGSTASTTSYTVTGLTNGVVYSFRIRAVNAGGNGAPSDEVTATPIDQDVVQADKARSQALAATSRTLLGMATDVLGSRTGGEAPVALAGSGNTLGEQAMGIVENLLGINGSELPTALTLEEVEDRLWSQSFQLTPPASGMGQEWNSLSPQQRSWALWGAGELRSYRGNDDAEHLSYSGNVKTAWLGMDHQFTDRWMAGAALSFATGQSDYSYQKTDGSKEGGKMESRLTVVYPYGSFQVSERLRLWGMAGMGWGSQHHQQTGDHTKAEGDLRLQMGVIGFEQALSPIGELNLSLAGDAGLVKSTTDWKAGSGLDDLSVSLHRIRLGIDSSFPLTAHTTGYLNLKGRLDGGDLEMNAAEIVAGLHYGKERFSGFLQGRQTYAFDGSYAESALTAQLRLTANTDGTGLAWTLQPSYGASDGDFALAAGPSLWTDEQLEALTGSGSAQENREIALSSRVGYGIHLQSGELLLTPFTEVRLREAGSQHIGLGLTLEGASWNLELSSSREKGANSSPTTKTELNFSKKL